MVRYTCGDTLTFGIPLGGIGTGGVELDNDGKLINARFANNWAYPISILRGFHIFIKPINGLGFFMHCRVDVLGFEGRTTLIDLEGRWPFAWLRASKDGINVEVEVFTPIIPGNLKDSTLPVIGFTIKVKGSDALAVVSMPNVVGTNPIGKINKSINNNGILFTNTKAPDNDPAKGDMALMAKEPKFIITQYNINAKPEYALKAKAWKNSFENSEPWLTIDKGNIPSGEESHEVLGLWDDPAGLIALNIPNGGEARLALSWFFNGKWHLYNYGHYYENFFRNSSEVAEYMLDEFDRLRAGTLD